MIVIGASFLSLSVDEVTIIDNQSWILVHTYVIHAWKIIPFLFTLHHVVEGGNVNNLIVVIVQALMQQRGLTQEETTNRLICFDVDGTSIFQGYYTKVTFQLKDKFVPYMMGQHCMAHWMNLAIQILSNLPMAKLENCSSHCILIFLTPLNAIWNSLSLLKSWK
jgi:hypothetical protein